MPADDREVRARRSRPQDIDVLPSLIRRARRVVHARNSKRFGLLAACALCGCAAVGPNFHSPKAPDLDRYTPEAQPAATIATDSPTGEAQRFLAGADVSDRWWLRFNSPELNRRVEVTLTSNPTVASAQAALRQAQENLAAVRGVLLPQVDARGGVERERTNTATIGSTAPALPAFTLYNASVNVSWGIDLFGGARRAGEAQEAAVDVQRFELEATYLALISNVVTASVLEASLRAQIDATNQVIGILGDQIDVTQKQVNIGSRAEGDLYPVRAQLAAQQAQLPPLRLALVKVQTQLALYLGRAPSQGDLPPIDLDSLALPVDIPVSVPSRLVEQRPDVRAADAVLHQATAQVGVATANMLPQISLNAAIGSQTAQAGTLLSAGSGIWSVGVGLLQPLFHGGTLEAQRRAAEAGLDRAVADYQNTVLGAFKNVADSLASLEIDAESLQAQSDAYKAADGSLHLVETQYRLGAANSLQLVDAQRQFRVAQVLLIQARAQRLADTAALFAALGGGWWNREGPLPDVRFAHDGTLASAQPVSTQPATR
jgi:NodT family efflux transporter outer membrane factor (OMF) lipoprotein